MSAELLTTNIDISCGYSTFRRMIPTMNVYVGKWVNRIRVIPITSLAPRKQSIGFEGVGMTNVCYFRMRSPTCDECFALLLSTPVRVNSIFTMLIACKLAEAHRPLLFRGSIR